LPRKGSNIVAVLWIAVAVLTIFTLVLGFILLGALRRTELLTWRVEQMEYRTPRRVGRDGLRPGTPAPDFELNSVQGELVSLSKFRGRQVLVVFTQGGCGPCHGLVADLKEFKKIPQQILVVHQGDRESAIDLAGAQQPAFPILLHEGIELWRKYEAFATPFLFLIDEKGVVISRGIAHNRQQVQFVLDREGVQGGAAQSNESSNAGGG
jgi:peroxiredoxin